MLCLLKPMESLINLSMYKWLKLEERDEVFNSWIDLNNEATE